MFVSKYEFRVPLLQQELWKSHYLSCLEFWSMLSFLFCLLFSHTWIPYSLFIQENYYTFQLLILPFSHLPTHSITVYPMVTIRISDRQRLIQPYIHNYSWLLFASLTLYSADLASGEEVEGEKLELQVLSHARDLQHQCIQLIGDCLMKAQHGKGDSDLPELKQIVSCWFPLRSLWLVTLQFSRKGKHWVQLRAHFTVKLTNYLSSKVSPSTCIISMQ